MRPFRSAAAVLLVAVSACGAHRSVVPRGADHAHVITAAEIEASAARDAWEVLQRSGNRLSLQETKSGQPARATKRGRGSISLHESPLLVVDGIQMVDLVYLRSIPARTIVTIRIMSGIEGTRVHGTGASGGVIDVRTKTGLDL